MTMFRAVIENNVSPLRDGRVQVRIFGLHEDDKETVKTEHLPWAEVMQSTAFGFSSGVGFSSIPNIGTWVFVVLDNDNPNMPIVMGAISGKSVLKSDTSKGFNSPDGMFPLKDRLNEEDQNRLQRISKLDQTIHQNIMDTLDETDESDSITGAKTLFKEPISLSDRSKYPDNAVIETKSGHVIEIDDSPENEKIRIYHRTGTYVDFRPDGSMIQKTVSGNNNYYIHSENINTHIEKCVKTHIDQNIDEIVGGYVKRHIAGDLREHVNGLFKLDVDGNIHFVGDLYVDGSIETTGKVTATMDISSKAEVADSFGNLSSLRDMYDGHEHNYFAGPTPAVTHAHPSDPKARWGDFSWTGAPISDVHNCAVPGYNYAPLTAFFDEPKPYQLSATVGNEPLSEASAANEIDEGNVVYTALGKSCEENPQSNPYDLSLSYLSDPAGWIETDTNPNIVNLWKEIGYVGKSEEFTANHTAWCAVYISAILKRTGNKYIQTASSQAYKNYGVEVKMEDIQIGDIVVFYRNGASSGFGHVGFYTGEKTATRISVLGGNQGNTLKISSFSQTNTSKGWGIRSIRRPISCDGDVPAPLASSGVGSATDQGGTVT